jgi:hypothetical protein
MIEGSGSVPRTNGFGSGRPKNIPVWIRIRNFVALGNGALKENINTGTLWTKVSRILSFM